MSDVEQFKNACRVYFYSLGIGDLRNYGREVGVSRPTAKNKDELIEDVIAILCGELRGIAVSKQGAPVKNARVDERIPQKVASLRREFLQNPVQPARKDVWEVTPEEEYFQVAQRKAAYDIDSDPRPKGQVVYKNGAYIALPLAYNEEDGVYLPDELVLANKLTAGDVITFSVRRSTSGALAATEIFSVNEGVGEGTKLRFAQDFASPSTERIHVYREGDSNAPALKFVEWLMPLAKGQRGCIVSPPKAGKTRLLLDVASAAKRLNRGLEVFALLVDQSPESVREFQRALGENRLVYTTYEDDAERQVEVANLLMERIKRLTECGKDVFLIVDSLTALARAYNETEESVGGKTLACGLEMKTVRYVRKYFGAARCLQGGGSITLLGAVASQTGIPFDDVVCSEFTTQANFLLRLDGALAARRVYPALDFVASNAQQSALLKTDEESELDFLFRNVALGKMGAEGAIKLLDESTNFSAFQNEVEALCE